MMGRGVKPPPPKAPRIVQESEELDNDDDYDVELSFERRPSFSTPVINRVMWLKSLGIKGSLYFQSL